MYSAFFIIFVDLETEQNTNTKYHDIDIALKCYLILISIIPIIFILTEYLMVNVCLLFIGGGSWVAFLFIYFFLCFFYFDFLCVPCFVSFHFVLIFLFCWFLKFYFVYYLITSRGSTNLLFFMYYKVVVLVTIISEITKLKNAFKNVIQNHDYTANLLCDDLSKIYMYSPYYDWNDHLYIICFETL